jgi:hypothetical protein
MLSFFGLAGGQSPRKRAPMFSSSERGTPTTLGCFTIMKRFGPVILKKIAKYTASNQRIRDYFSAGIPKTSESIASLETSVRMGQ